MAIKVSVPMATSSGPARFERLDRSLDRFKDDAELHADGGDVERRVGEGVRLYGDSLGIHDDAGDAAIGLVDDFPPASLGTYSRSLGRRYHLSRWKEARDEELRPRLPKVLPKVRCGPAGPETRTLAAGGGRRAGGGPAESGVRGAPRSARRAGPCLDPADAGGLRLHARFLGSTGRRRCAHDPEIRPARWFRRYSRPARGIRRRRRRPERRWKSPSTRWCSRGLLRERSATPCGRG